MKRTKLLLENPPQSVPKKDSKDVLVKSQILKMDDKEVLNIDLFYGGRCQGRYLADHETHYFYIDGKWKTCNLKNAARLSKGKEAIKNDYYYVRNEWEWDSKEDKETALEYLNSYSIESYEDKISCKKIKLAMERKLERIQKTMEWIPSVTEEIKTWIKEEIFPGDILFFSKNETGMKYFCTACGKRGRKKKPWKHGKQMICPKCGKEAVTNSRQLEREKKAPIVILQAEKGKWVERQFVAICRWSQEGKELTMYEQCRAVMNEGQCWGKVYYGTYRQADEFEQEFWDTNSENKRFLESYLYPGNLQEALSYGKLEESGLDRIAKEKRKIHVNKFITTYHQRPYIEYLNKAGLTRMVTSIVNNYGWYGDPRNMNLGERKLKDVLKLDGNRTHRMKQMNGTLVTLEWLQYEQKNNLRISQESLDYLTEKKVYVEDCEDILKELKSVNRMVNYMKKQKTAPGRLAIVWKDYLRMAAEEGMNTNDDIVRLPKDVKARHDTLVEIRNERSDKERMEKGKKKYAALDAEIKKHLPEATRYCWEDRQYRIVPAEKCEELMKEGRALHHCVGASDRYMEKMAEGKTWICFLRKKKEPDKPYYTLEIKMENDKILQWYSEFDRKPDEKEVGKVLEKFKKQLKAQRQTA